MNRKSQKYLEIAGLDKAISRGLFISLPAILLTNLAVATPQNENHKQLSQTQPGSNVPHTEPHHKKTTPAKPKAQSVPSQSTSPQPAPETTIQTPLPEQQQPPSATVIPVNGQINVQLMNATNAVVSYQVIGDTDQRTLASDSNVTLRNLKTPVTITFEREDRGLLKTITEAPSQGVLQVTLDETTNLKEDSETVRVESSGQVFVN